MASVLKKLSGLFGGEVRTPASKPEGTMYADSTKVFSIVQEKIRHTDSVLDIGPGLRPMNFFVPKTHIMVEGFGEYIPLLQKRFSGQPGAVFIHALAEDALKLLPDKSVDSVFMLDVLEHMERPVAAEVLRHCERIARVQVVIETPCGFVEQEYEEGEKDGWNFAYNALQNHRSGWSEEDFRDGWELVVCKEFGKHHQTDEPYGLMYAFKNLTTHARLPGKALLVSTSVPPHGNNALLEKLLGEVDPQDIVIFTDEENSPYAPNHHIEDAVAFAKNRLDAAYATMPNLLAASYESLSQHLQRITIQHGITHLLVMEESPILLKHLKKFSKEQQLPILFLTPETTEPEAIRRFMKS